MSIGRTTRIRQHTFVVAFAEPHAEAIERRARELGISPETVIRDAMLDELAPKPDRSLPALTKAVRKGIAGRRRSSDPFQRLLD